MSKILDLARQIRRGNRFKNLVATPRRVAIAARQRGNRGIYSIEIEAHAGFFAVIQTILFILVYCKERNLYADISCKGGIYGDSKGEVDWLGLLFDRIGTPSGIIAERLRRRTDIKTSRIKGVEDLGLRERYELGLTLREASDLFNSQFAPKSEVQLQVDAIGKELGVSSQTLAVHYRGTDKVHEAGNLKPSVIFEAVEKALIVRPNLQNILLASDEVTFIQAFRQYPFKIPVVVAPASYMPRGDKPIHFSGHPGLEIGREALLTCLLLSRCGFLVKTASYLSGWSKIFNPALPTWLLSPQFGTGYFPDRALWKDQLEERNGFKIPGSSQVATRAD